MSETLETLETLQNDAPRITRVLQLQFKICEKSVEIREGEIKRERERDTERETDRDRERQRDRERSGETDHRVDTRSNWAS